MDEDWLGALLGGEVESELDCLTRGIRAVGCDLDEEVSMAVSVESRPVRVRPAPPRRTAEAIVEARGVDKLYDTGKLQVRALNGVSFAVPRGEMVAIMGPSGSGKTTLLNCLSGLDRIDAGEVLIEGVALSSMSDEERTD